MEKTIIDLAINKDYLKGSWGVAEAVREIMQNCIDAGRHEIDAEEDDGTITFTTHSGAIGIDKLALGSTTKADSPEFIGKYGEGLKLGMVALLREGRGIVIHNGNQLWEPFIGHSQTFGCDTLQISISDDASHGSDDVDIEVSGLTEDDFDTISDGSLEMEEAINGGEPSDTAETEYGTIIHDDDYAGRIYVGGIFVQEDDDVKFGFDFKPDKVRLDRDRKLIDYHQLMDLVADAVIDEGDPDTVYDCYRDSSFSDQIVDRIGNLNQRDESAFVDDYLGSKRKKDSEGVKVELTQDNVLLVDQITADYLKSHAEKVPYQVVVEDNDSLAEEINNFTDDDQGKKSDLIADLSEKAEAWKKVKDSGEEMLNRFNASDYKQMLSIINKLKAFKIPEVILGFLRTKALSGFAKYEFDSILQYVDPAKVTDAPYVIDFSKVDVGKKAD
jgi:hypothetical protein